jgi:ABC-type proline/glycine betaine transport system substrate-binding protein
LEQQESHHDRTSVETAFRTGTATATGEIANREKEEAGMKVYSWSATEVLNWTMMQWLPGSVRNRFTTTPTPTYVLLCIPSAVHGFLENNYPILGSC